MERRLKHLAVLALVILLTASCARISGVRDPDRGPAAKLFEAAEKYFATSEYDRALALFEEYLEAHPKDRMVPTAMLKVGMIRTERNEFEDARDMYARLNQLFPDTEQALAGQVETLVAYFREGRYDAVVDYHKKLDKERFPAKMKMRMDFIAGDAFLKKGAYEKAFGVLLEAFFEAPDARRRNHAGMRLAEAASHVDIDRLESFMEELKGKAPAAYLFYGKGLNLAQAGRIGDAITLLAEFSDRFPRHALAETVAAKIADFEQMAYFEGHRIGVLLPLTGQFGVFGQSTLRGIELALAEYSEKFEVDPSIEILVYDTASDPELTVQGVRMLAENKVAVIIGPNVMAEAAAKESQALGVPIITLSQRAGLTEVGDYVFRNFLTPGMQVNALVDYAIDTLGLEKFAVLYPDEAYGETFLHLFWDRLVEKNGIIVGAEKYNPGKTDFSDPIRRLVGLYYDVPEELRGALAEVDEAGLDTPEGFVEIDPETEDAGEAGGLVEEDKDRAIIEFDALFIPESAAVGGLIVPQLRYHDINDVYLFGTNLWHSRRLIDIAGRQLRQVVIPEAFFPQSHRPHVSLFMTRFREIFGSDPGIIEASGFDSAMMVFELITDPGIDNRVALKHALHVMPPFYGVTGETRFNETGDAIKKLYLLEVVRGEFREIRN